jgi:hypothetical protein
MLDHAPFPRIRMFNVWALGATLVWMVILVLAAAGAIETRWWFLLISCLSIASRLDPSGSTDCFSPMRPVTVYDIQAPAGLPGRVGREERASRTSV